MILNLTQHTATQAQLDAGVFEPSDQDKEFIKRYLTFDELPTSDEVEYRAKMQPLPSCLVAHHS